MEIQASPVTLEGPMTLGKALDKVFEQTGNRVLVSELDATRNLQVNLSNVPFWTALDRLARLADLRVTVQDEERGLVRLSGKAPQILNVAYRGPFRLAIQSIDADTDRSNPELSSLNVKLELLWEPRYRPLLMRLAPETLSGVDAADTKLNAVVGSRGDIQLVGKQREEIALRFRPLPPRRVESLKLVEGKFFVRLPPETLELRFDKLVAGASQPPAAGMNVHLDRIEVEPDLWTIGITMQYPDKTLDLGSFQTWIVDDNEVFLENIATKNRLDKAKYRGYSVSVAESGPIHVAYRFAGVPGKPEDWRLIYRLPAPPLRVPVEFRFENIPLQ
jgi:hypothetical protein